MNLCQVVPTVTSLPPPSRLLRVIQPLRSIPFARFFPLFYYFLENFLLSLSLCSFLRGLNQLYCQSKGLAVEKSTRRYFVEGRERINPVSRFYDFLKKKSQRYVPFFTPSLSRCMWVTPYKYPTSFVFTVFFFPFHRSGNSGTGCTFTLLVFLGLLAIDLHLANHSGTRCSFHRRAYFSRKDRANFISKERINQNFFEILPIWKNFKFFTVTINNIYRERFVE